MPKEALKKIKELVEFLDDEMVKNPSRELADVSNYLQELLNKEKI